MVAGGSTKEKRQSNNSTTAKAPQSSSLTRYLIAGVAICVSVSGAFNILYAHHGSYHTETAVHAAVKDFKEMGITKPMKKTKVVERVEALGKKDKAQGGGGGGDDDSKSEDEDKEDDVKNNDSSEEEEEDDDVAPDAAERKKKNGDEEKEEGGEDDDDAAVDEEKNGDNGSKENNKDDDHDNKPADASSSKKKDDDGKKAAAAADTEAKLDNLDCSAYGGPANEFAQEMVYWYKIPSDEKYVSPFHAKHRQHKRYMSFEPDGGGWNNIRMAMETVIGLAIAMGRTLVMPPAQRMYLLRKGRGDQRTDFGFADFFHIKEMADENTGLEIITMKQFLETEAMKGNMKDKNTGKVSFPPGNKTDWDGEDVTPLKEWLREVTHTPLWGPSKCLAAFPASGDHKDVEALKETVDKIHKESPIKSEYIDDPAPVDGTPFERMREIIASRNDLCVYNEEMQNEPYVHFMCYHKLRVRMLTHFYAFLFFEDWREDLWMKRFMRDHVRYTDEIQCAAARIVHAMRDYVKNKKTGSNPSGEFDTFHVRRGDFQFKRTRISAEEIYENTKDILEDGATIFIATDERDKNFFDPLRKHYDLKFMDDFKDLLEGVNTNYYGMIDQLVASRGRKFLGCWHSTFTGFIHRMRGYRSVQDKWVGHEKGLLPTSYYYTPKVNEGAMHKYSPLHGAFFNREFPTSWRDIDKSIGNLPNVLAE